MIDFWLLFIALLYALFSVGRLLLPDPDRGLGDRSSLELRRLREALSTRGSMGILAGLLFSIICLFYFPYHRPWAGLTVSALLLLLLYFV